MVKMKDSSKRFLLKNLPDVVDALNPNEILDPLYDLIVYKGFISHEEGYNDFGNEAQAVYDDIFYSNYD